MDPATIALIMGALDLAVKAAPEVIELVAEIKAAISKAHPAALAQIGVGTIQCDAQTLEILAPLLKGKS